MGKSWLFASLMFGVLLAATATTHGDGTQTPSPALPPATDAVPEMITGTAVTPAPGSETVRHDPFTPYDIGPTPWSYNQLTAGEKVVADAGRDTSAWPVIHSAYNTAVVEQAQLAAAAAAQYQLGIDNLITMGVLP